VELRHHLEGLEMLGKDTLHVFRVGQAAASGPAEDDPVPKTLRAGELMEDLLRGWNILYDDTDIRVEWPQDQSGQRICLHRPLTFRRVLRVLLHNALRHGREWMRLFVEIKPRSAKVEDTPSHWLELRIANPSFADMVEGLRKGADLATGTFGVSPLARGSLGLTVARQLITEAGAALEEPEVTPEQGTDRVFVEVRLHWPVTLESYPLEDAI
jgi:hypothetical protein